MYNSRIAFVADILDRHGFPPKKILDVGFIGSYREATTHYKIVDKLKESDSLVGIDIDRVRMNQFLNNPKTIKFQKKNNLQYELLSIFNTNFKDNTFDYVLLLEVFEHLFTPYSVLKEIRRILKKKGVLIITYPNPLSLNKIVKYTCQRNLLDSSYLNNFKRESDHKIFPHPVCFEIYLNETGFQTKAIEFIKYDFKYRFIPYIILARIGLIRKFSNYVGISAIKI